MHIQRQKKHKNDVRCFYKLDAEAKRKKKLKIKKKSVVASDCSSSNLIIFINLAFLSGESEASDKKKK